MTTQPRAKKKRVRGPKPENRPSVRVSYGFANCLYCRRRFEKTRAWQKFDSPYCKMMNHHVSKRRVGPQGVIVEVDGQRLEQPVPQYDQKLAEKAESDIEKLGTEMKDWMYKSRTKKTKDVPLDASLEPKAAKRSKSR